MSKLASGWLTNGVTETEAAKWERELHFALEELEHLGLVERTSKDGEEAWQLSAEGRIATGLLFSGVE